MANYYFLAPSLPVLQFGVVPDITFEELTKRLEINFTKADYEKAVVIRRYIDLYNIRALLLEESIDPRGNLSEKELDEALLVQTGLPDYVFDFLATYDTLVKRLEFFQDLIAHYFREEIQKSSGFLHDYLNFERRWRLVLLALRARSFGRDFGKELQFEEVTDPFVAEILAQKDSATFEPPAEFQELKDLYLSTGSDPMIQYRAFAKWHMQRLEELVKTPLFSTDWILAYMVRLLIIEYCNQLDQKKGRLILDTFKT